ncbi:hypothetical protein ACEPAF_9180 [Sanghuangporus sanghuang]
MHRSALILLPETDPGHCASSANLVNSLLARFNQSGNPDDLDETITLCRATLAQLPKGSPNHFMSLSNLASSLLARFELCGQSSVQKGILIIRRHCVASKILCIVVFRRKAITEDFEGSIHLLDSASSHKFSSTSSRILAARQWAALARSHDHQSTLRAYSAAMSLLQRAITIR